MVCRKFSSEKLNQGGTQEEETSTLAIYNVATTRLQCEKDRTTRGEIEGSLVEKLTIIRVLLVSIS